MILDKRFRPMSDVRIFNEQLLLVLRAGVPVAIGDMYSASQIEAFIAKLGERIATAPGTPAEIDDLIEKDISLPADYRDALSAWKSGERTSRSMQSLFECGNIKSEMRWSITKVLLPLLLLLWLVAQGMTLFIGYIYPNLKEMYRISNLQPSASLRFLEFLSNYSGIGALVATSLMLLIFLLWLRVPAWLVPIVPTHGLAIRSVRQAQQMERDARCARALLFETDGEGKEQVATVIRSNELSAALCREASAFTSRQWLRWFPMIAGALLSGLMVFGYVFCLFWPGTDLLHQLSKP
jgi:type II secretory pathway component PulF